MSFKEKYVSFWMAIDARLGAIESAAVRWEKARLDAPPSRYKQWADSPYTSRFFAGPGPSGKRLGQVFDALYENKLSRWISGKR